MGEIRNGVYYFKAGTGGVSIAAIKSKETTLWHQRSRHPSVGSLSIISTICEFQFNKDSLQCCDVCIKWNKSGILFLLVMQEQRNYFPWFIVIFGVTIILHPLVVVTNSFALSMILVGLLGCSSLKINQKLITELRVSAPWFEHNLAEPFSKYVVTMTSSSLISCSIIIFEKMGSCVKLLT